MNGLENKKPFISIIIPNYNGAKTIGECIDAVLSSKVTESFEVVVVDDHSVDDSIDIIKQFPCELIHLNEHSGASRARNEGARHARGEVLFFIDRDCIVQKDTIANAVKAYKDQLLSGLTNPRVTDPPDSVIGGTYTALPYDKDFFSTFQSIFINYSETKGKADYIATHAMIINSGLFKKSKGFKEDFLPIIEDVEFSHRLKREGVRLIIKPEILVRHIFNFSLIKSLKNALKKSMYWTVYSLRNRDIFKDSGTASIELKVNVVSLFLCLLMATLYFLFNTTAFLAPIPVIISLNLFINRHFIRAMFHAKGLSFGMRALFYYITLYALFVGAGAFQGVLMHLFMKEKT